MKQAMASTARGLRIFGSDVADGFFEITHNGFALIGLSIVFAPWRSSARPDLREIGRSPTDGLAQSRKPPVAAPEPTDLQPNAIERATAANPKDLPKQQAAVAYWLSKKYRVAPEPLSALVAEAYEIGERTKLDPTLILAMMAVESGFNPFAQSPVGAQGLMQVMTGVHSDKYENFGGKLAAFDPVTNLRVGVKVLQECIQRAGSLAGRPEVLRRRGQAGGRRRLCREGDGRTRAPAAGRRRQGACRCRRRSRCALPRRWTPPTGRRPAAAEDELLAALTLSPGVSATLGAVRDWR